MGKFITNDRIDLLLKQGRVEEALLEPVKQPNPSYSGVGEFVFSRSRRRCPSPKTSLMLD